LRTLLLLFVVLGSSLAVFGGWGIVVFALATGLAVFLRHVESLSSLILALFVFSLLHASWVLWSITDMDGPERRFNWPNIAALAVWLASVGTLLVGAVRGRKPRSVSPVLPPVC
jgi:CDP-diglyceride synthetase